MTQPRLNRLLGPDGRCLVVAIDHGQFNEPSWLGRIRDMEEIVAAHVAAGPDALTLAAGQAPLLQSVPGRQRPSLIMRSDHTNAYSAARSGPAFCFALDNAVERAVALDAAAVVCGLLSIPGEPGLYRECLENFTRMRRATEQAGLPLIAEVLAMTLRADVPGVTDDVEVIATLARQAAELGADIVKTDPTARTEDYAEVVAAAGGRPVFVSGGSPVPGELKAGEVEAATIRRSAGLLAAGAAGLSYGRPVVWAGHPPALTRALAALVHDGATVEQAIVLYEEGSAA